MTSASFYAAQPLRAGLVILIPNVGRALQRTLFRAALDDLAVTGEPVIRRQRNARRGLAEPVIP
jgi:hypothetical protein